MAEADVLTRLFETGGPLGLVLALGWFGLRGLLPIARDYVTQQGLALKDIVAGVKDVSRAMIEMRADMAEMRRDQLLMRRDLDVLFERNGATAPSWARERGGKTEGERGE